MAYAKENPSGLASKIPMGKQSGNEAARFYSNNFSLVSPIRSNVTSVATPVISPDPGTYPGPLSVSITCATLGALIYYTTDGSTPDASSTLYSGAFDLNSSATVKAIAIYGGAVFSSIASSAFTVTNFIVATGGTITTDGDYKVHTFNSSGTFQVTSGSGNVWYLVVGGGGGGAGASDSLSGGGGAGRYRSNAAYDYAVTTGSYSVIVGAGGAPGASGKNSGSDGSSSSFDSITSEGGGFGATQNADGNPGGSGGGGGQGLSRTTTGGAAGGALSNAGGGANAPNKSAGAGGGGAGAAAATVTVNNVATDGGIGVASAISGASVYYAGGGGGSGYATAGVGGLGGGGNGDLYTAPAGSAGTANKGGGGGGGGAAPSVPGYAGGSGVVIIRYKFQ